MSTPEQEVNPSAREEYEQAHAVVKALRPLLESPGWKILCDVARAQIEARQISNSVPMYKVDDVFHRQLAAGEVLGLQLALATPAAMLEDAIETLERLKTEVKDE